MLTLMSFLGGSAFRLIFGGVMDWMNKRQDHQHEMDLQRLQSELEAGRHARDLERLRLQSDLNVAEVHVMADAAEQKVMADAFLEAVKGTSVKTGVLWVDAWNACIRPAGASFSMVLWIASVVAAYFAADAAMIAAWGILTEFDKTLIAAFLGVFVGDRIHSRMLK